MTDAKQIISVHALVILPDKRILLKRRLFVNGTVGKWSATIERIIFETDNPDFQINNAVLDDLNITLTLKHVIPKATIKSLNIIKLSDCNTLIHPYVVKIKKRITLRTNRWCQLIARPFSVLAEDIMCQTIYRHHLAEAQHTINTIHVMKEVHLGSEYK